MNRTTAPPILALALFLGACALPSPPPAVPLAGETSVKKVDRLSFQDPPQPNLFRVAFDAERSNAIRSRSATEAPGDRSDPYHALMQYLEQVAEQELQSRGLCGGSAKLMSVVDGINGTGPMSAIFACRPPVF